MDGFPPKLAGELHTYNYNSNTQPFGSVSAGGSGSVEPMTTSYGNQQTQPSNQAEGSTGLMAGPSTSLQEDHNEGTGVSGNVGRKKKKKQKNNEDPVKDNMMDEDELKNLPILSENQGVEDLLFPASLPPPGGTVPGGQYPLNSSLLDQILTEKKMQLLQSPEVIQMLRERMPKK